MRLNRGKVIILYNKYWHWMKLPTHIQKLYPTFKNYRNNTPEDPSLKPKPQKITEERRREAWQRWSEWPEDLKEQYGTFEDYLKVLALPRAESIFIQLGKTRKPWLIPHKGY